jgi:hypothetical protein
VRKPTVACAAVILGCCQIVHAQSAPQPAASGRVTQFLTNPNGDVDGFLLQDGTQVQFPPHLSAALVRVVRPGDSVEVQGFRGAQVPVVHALTITNSTTQQNIVDQPPRPDALPPPPPAPGSLGALKASGAITRLLYTDRGDLNGFLLADNTTVHFPPPAGLQLNSQLKAGEQIAASGYGTQNSFGRSLEATSISINGGTAIAVNGAP